MTIVVIGVGHPDRGDDDAGPAVAALLRERLPPSVRLCVRTGNLLGILDDWADCETAICVDAAEPAGEPGRIHRFDLAESPLPHDVALPSSHSIGLAEAIALARTLDQLPQRVIVHAIEGANFAIGAPMTPCVAAAVPQVADRIIQDIAALSATTANGASGHA